MGLPLLLLLLLLVVVVILFRLLYLRPRLPPGPRPWPVVGNLYQIKSVRFRCFAEWAQSYGPIISVWEGSTLNVVVSSSKLAREVLNEKDRHLANRYRSRAVSKLTGHGGGLIWADYNPRYVKLRKVCTAALLSAKSLESLRPMREDEVTAMVESIYTECRGRGRRSVLLEKYVKVLGFNNITRMVFGKRYAESEGEGEEMKAVAAERERKLLARPIAEHVPWLRWLFPLDNRAFAEHAARKDRLMRRIINDHTTRSLQTDGAKHVLFNTLITVIDKYGLTGHTGTGLLWDIIHAGMDTTAISVEWGMAELIKNPLVQHKAQEELDRVIGHDRVMTEQDIPNLPYLRCIVKESLRLHPPTPLMLPHRASVDVTIGGYHVPKGTTVLVNVWAVAHDPLVWENPLDFHPERFLEDDVDIRGRDFRLLPFGAGRRMCPGAQLSIDLVTSIIGHLLHHFSWSPPDGVRPEEVDIRETVSPGLVSSIETPLEAVPTPRLATNLYKRKAVDI